jgi:molybdopterin-biosynthesis enzyme MoeA-like protein
MAFGLIIIGDEIMSGRRADKHFPKLLELLGQRGLQLSWARYLGDEPDRIIAVLRETLATGDVVFCTGGIGATPDDHTRQCVAAALNVPLALHPEARDKIRERIADTAATAGTAPAYDTPDNLHRLKMGEFPVGSDIIPNPFNKIPGFSVANTSGSGRHYFAPGFPVMAWPMFEWVLDTHYADLFHQTAWEERSVFVYGVPESILTPLMEEIESEFAGVKVFSLPHVGEDGQRPHIDLGVKGDPVLVAEAFVRLEAGLQALNAEYAAVGVS